MTLQNVKDYWTAVLTQNADAMFSFFSSNAWINWHNTNEHFSVKEFIFANCKYPGKWEGEIERILFWDELVITVVRVYALEQDLSFHVTSFMEVKDGKITAIDEYWGDDGEAPQWRRELNIGSKIK